MFADDEEVGRGVGQFIVVQHVDNQVIHESFDRVRVGQRCGLRRCGLLLYVLGLHSVHLSSCFFFLFFFAETLRRHHLGRRGCFPTFPS